MGQNDGWRVEIERGGGEGGRERGRGKEKEGGRERERGEGEHYSMRLGWGEFHRKRLPPPLDWSVPGH